MKRGWYDAGVMRFVDRDMEVAALHERFAGPSSLTLLYGQRRVGKTWLLRHVLDGRDDALYFCADESTASALQERLVAEVRAAGWGGALWDAAAPRDWAGALALLFEAARGSGRALVLALDEFQYLLAADPSITSVLQRLWDEYGPRARIHVVLCGSALGTLARLGESGQPLHGRFDLRLRLAPFTCAQAAGFAPGWSAVDRLRLYGVFGGLARHLAEVDEELPLDANAIRALVRPLGVLHDAPLDILRTEHLSSHAEASAVLTAVAAGENRFGSIAARAGLAGPRLDYVLRELLALEVLRREVRFGDRKGSRYVRYRCVDPLTVFWFRHVLPQRSALLGTSPEGIWRERIAPRLDDHMGPIFEEVVRQALTGGLLADEVGVVEGVAPWWSRDGQTEVDLVARTAEGLLFVECKWRASGEVDVRTLERLQGHAERTGLGRGRLMIATAGGFSDRLRQAAEGLGVALVGPERLLQRGRGAT